MQGPENHQRADPGVPGNPHPAWRGWIWLLAGTADGPELASALRRQGWGVRVSVVSASALKAYGSAPDLELSAGPLDGVAAIAAELHSPRRYAAVVDATHPFAVRISAALTEACAQRQQPLLRLRRLVSRAAAVEPIPQLEDLRRCNLTGERLLLAIGRRQLVAAVVHSPGALHHARLLPTATALQDGIAAGLAPERLALVRPSRSGWIEAGLLRHWRITAVLAREGGGFSEAVWQRLAEQHQLRLLLLQRPDADLPAGGIGGLSMEELLELLAHWHDVPLAPPPIVHG